MKKTDIVLSLLFFLCQHAYATTKFINAIPDFTQTKIVGDRHGNGKQFCGPVAVSNSLVWLANKPHETVSSLAKILAGKRFMNTKLTNGTGTKGMLRGIERISNELFGGYKSLRYQGWRMHQQKFSTSIKVPTYSWVTHHISSKSAVWLNIGWYKKKSSQHLQRIGGHWVTLVGFEGNDTLVIHDPAPRAGQNFSNEFVKVKTMDIALLTGKKKGLPISAKGWLSLEEGMHIKSKADLAILDGAIALTIH